MFRMSKYLVVPIAGAALAVSATASAGAGPAPDRRAFSDPAQITNPYLPISDFRRCRLAGVDDGQRTRITRTLLDRTKAFHFHGERVDAAIVKDRVVAGGRLIELTHDYFAQNDAGKVFYFGERVNEYGAGGHIGHGGQWLLGKEADHPGVLMPAHPRIGSSFRSERVPGVTHEIDHVVASKRHEQIAGHRYDHVITVRENARPPRETEFKKYARGIGVVAEANGGIHLLGCSAS